MNFTLDERYRVAEPELIDSPALLVFPDIIAKNIEETVRLCGTPQYNCLRPHIKTVKCAEIARMAMDRGITRFKCSTVAEGEMLGSVGAEEVLLSYQLSTVKARRWQRLRELYPDTRFASLVDNLASAKAAVEMSGGAPVEVYVDLNVGMHRTGIAPASAPKLVEAIRKLPGLIVRGLHVYDGHIHDPDYEARRVKTDAVYEEAQALREVLEARDGTAYEMVMGGSPTFSFYVGKPNVTVSPGTFYLWDAGYGKAYPELPFEPAAVLLMRVLSIIDGRKMCFDLGSKATSPDTPLPRVVIPTIENYRVVGQHEEHLVIEVPDTSIHRVGEVHYAISMHICPTVALYENLLPVRGGLVGKPWPVVARNRRITI